jgi:hypothetical protein
MAPIASGEANTLNLSTKTQAFSEDVKGNLACDELQAKASLNRAG